MALAWKAGWVHALAGSNPASSATLTRCNAAEPTAPVSTAGAVVSVLVSVGIPRPLLLGPQEPSDLGRHHVPDRVRRMLLAGSHRRARPTYSTSAHRGPSRTEPTSAPSEPVTRK